MKDSDLSSRTTTTKSSITKRPFSKEAMGSHQIARDIASGHHVLFAAQVQHWPFGMMAHSAWESLEHPVHEQLLERQLRFISSLCMVKDRLPLTSQVTIELRYISHPGEKIVKCILLGKVFDLDEVKAKAGALILWENLASVMPAGYNLIPASDEKEYDSWSGNEFAQNMADQWAIVRRSASWLPWTDEKLPTRQLPAIYPYGWQPFGWEDIWAVQARSIVPTLISVSLRPVNLTQAEEFLLSALIQELNSVANDARPPLSIHAKEANDFYQNYLQALWSLFETRFLIIGPSALRLAVLGALSDPTGSYRKDWGRAEILEPTDDHLPVLRDNFTFLEQIAWEPVSLPDFFERFRYLLTPRETQCVFRLPLLPENNPLNLKIGSISTSGFEDADNTPSSSETFTPWLKNTFVPRLGENPSPKLNDNAIGAELLSSDRLRLKIPLPSFLPVGYLSILSNMFNAISFVYSMLAVFNSQEPEIIKAFWVLLEKHKDSTTISEDGFADLLSSIRIKPIQMVAIHYGSPVSIDILGVGTVLEMIRDIIKDVAWRGQHEKLMADRERAKADLELKSMQEDMKKTRADTMKTRLEYEAKLRTEKFEFENTQRSAHLQACAQIVETMEKISNLPISESNKQQLFSVIVLKMPAIVVDPLVLVSGQELKHVTSSEAAQKPTIESQTARGSIQVSPPDEHPLQG